MVSPNLVIDIAVDPADLRRRRRRTLLRLGVPVLGVLLMIAVILYIAIYSERADRAGVLALSDDVLSGLDSRIALEVSGYLDPAARAVRIIRGMMGQNAVTLPAEAQANGATVLREISQIQNLSFADEEGNYILVRRGAGGGTEAKIIDNTPGARRVDWLYRDASGAVVAQKEDPSDPFDPRTRPWYIGATGTDELFWTGAYIFFTDRKPGITVSARNVGPDKRIQIYGVDISLEALSHFLGNLPIGSHGRAVIIDRDGNLIAAPSGSVMRMAPDGTPIAARIDQFGDAALIRAYDEFRTEGPGRHMSDVAGQPYIVTATPLPTAGRDWVILIAVPEADFVGFIAANNRRALSMSLIIVFVAAALGLLLIHQGLRADRATRLVNERQHTIHRQSAAFARIAAEAHLFDPAHDAPPASLTETLIDTLGGRRATIWRLGAGARSLVCEDSYDGDSRGHTDGLELHHDELPRFFDALDKGTEILSMDAARDRQAAEFHRTFMAPFGSRRLLAIPVRRAGVTAGAVTVEDAPQDAAQTGHAQDFLRALANMLALRMSRAPAAAPREARPAEKAQTTTLRSFSADLRAEGIDPAALEATVYPTMAVMMLQFTDPAALALRAGGEGPVRSLSDDIVRRAQAIAIANDIPYLKLVGHEMVAAAGADGSADHAIARIADAALALRDLCLACFEQHDRALAFRIGIDCGLALGSVIGSDPPTFNIWGQAVQTAATMASSAQAGSIQVSEAVYDRLRRDFLLRARGRFYLPHLGEAQTFILASRS